MDFKNKVVIVTGASSGIGEATAVRLAQLSAKLVLTGRNEAKLKEVAQKVEKAKGIKPLIVKADVTNDGEVMEIVVQTIKCFGKIDVLINNAGQGQVAKTEDGIEPFDNMIKINLRSAYLLTHFAAPSLSKTRGNIVNVSSIGGMKPFSVFMPYCVAKAGLDMFTKCAAKDLAPQGVRVNSVNPGPVTTDFRNRVGTTKQHIEKMAEGDLATPIGRASTSEEVADVIIFLASDLAKCITGSLYVIDSGYLL